MSISEQYDRTFKALASPIRRQMLDQLRDQPLTTGMLCGLFPELDRCTVMQHLKVLEDADLVITAEAAHRAFILDDHAAAFRKVFTLGQVAEVVRNSPDDLSGEALLRALGDRRGPSEPHFDVRDPYGRGPKAAEEAARQIDELLRVVGALQLTDAAPVATPADWTKGEKVIVSPAMSTDDAKERFGADKVEEVKPYLRWTDDPS